MKKRKLKSRIEKGTCQGTGRIEGKKKKWQNVEGGDRPRGGKKVELGLLVCPQKTLTESIQDYGGQGVNPAVIKEKELASSKRHSVKEG